MSGIFGIFNRNRAPVNPAELAGMHAIYAQWFNEDRGQWLEGNIGLGHTMHWNTPESSLEKLPAVQGEPGSRLVITSHTRLDNRTELVDQLKIRKPIASVTDSELILAAYRKWQEDCPKHLLGDFAFAIWDERSSRLFCARDHMGIQPLFYRIVNSQFTFANNIEPLVQGCFPRPKLKRETIAKFLRDGENYSAADTFFDGVFQLPAGSYLTVDASNVTVIPYWSLHGVQPLNLGSIDDYSEMLLALLQDSVCCRLHSLYPLGAHLTGGLDSSGIVACAGSMDAVDTSNLTTFSWMPAPQSQEEFAAPEWAMAREVAEAYALPHIYTDFTAQHILELLQSHDIAMGDTVDVWAEKPLATRAAGMGIRTMLSGWGGDQLITHYGNDLYAERASRGDLFAGLWELLRAARSRNKLMTSFPSRAYAGVVRPLVRAYLVTPGSRYRGLGMDFLDYASPELAVVAAKAEPLLAYNGIYLREQQLCAAQLAHLGNRISSWAVSGRKFGLNYAYPLLDKRLVEMAVAIPPELFRKNDVPRYLFRRTVKNMKPEGFWHRDQKYEPNRVEKLLRKSVEASKVWALAVDSGDYPGDFIDVRRLTGEIDTLQSGRRSFDLGSARKIMAINRSILVLGLHKYV